MCPEQTEAYRPQGRQHCGPRAPWWGPCTQSPRLAAWPLSGSESLPDPVLHSSAVGVRLHANWLEGHDEPSSTLETSAPARPSLCWVRPSSPSLSSGLVLVAFGSYVLSESVGTRTPSDRHGQWAPAPSSSLKDELGLSRWFPFGLVHAGMVFVWVLTGESVASP